MLERANGEGVKRVRLHLLLDGRDVSETSALIYVESTEKILAEINKKSDRDYRIASGGGRQTTTMDRYGADWRIVERGWKAHVLGEARGFASAHEAIETYRKEMPGVIDQDLPAFTSVDAKGKPIGPIQDGDSVILFNFRGDRAIEISRAFDDPELRAFDRVRRPDALYAGMMEYDGDLHIPRHFLVAPPEIDRPMGELLAAAHISQLAISETQKYGHVTYFWNGNRSGMFDSGTETYIEIPSDNVPFDQRPWMKAAEITDRLIAELRTGKHRFARVNYANGDMVGHTGSFDATVIAVETVDLQLARLARAVEELQGILVVTADHGNADEMFQRDKSGKITRDKKTGQPVVKTSHTLNAVPFLIHDPARSDRYEIDPARVATAGIANVTATCLELLGLTPPDDLEPSLLRFR
jgi:2,3-bisphosphoglycerate-independent phosphoglycerate mutase